MEILRRVRGRGVMLGSDLLDSGTAEFPSNAAGSSRSAKVSPFDDLFPDAETLAGRDGGRCRRVRSRVALDGARSAQGYCCPADDWAGPPARGDLASLTGDRRWDDVDPGRVVYLDTETTSLATGAGTYTFLVGLGRFETGRFTVEQFYMEDYGDEPALIDHLDAALARAEAIVTYNGRSFDLPLLEARWRMQRREPRFPALHLDLLHHARRLWRLRLPDCSLSTVESRILDVDRMNDVDGALIPSIYFDFLRGARPERMVAVFDHHAQDIFTLGALASALIRGLREPGDERFAHAGDQWGLARLYERLGRPEEAIAAMERAVLAARDEDFAYRLAMRLARAYKRRGRIEEAVAIWEARVAQSNVLRLEALVALAVHAEHTLRDFHASRRWTRRALDIIEQHTELTWHGPRPAGETESRQARAIERHAEALRHRLARLEWRLERLGAKDIRVPQA